MHFEGLINHDWNIIELDATVYNIHVCTTTDDDDDEDRSRLISVESFAFCLPFLAAYRLNISLKKHLQSCCKNLFPTREPHIKKSAVSELFFLYLYFIYIYIKLMKEFRLICAH